MTEKTVEQGVRVISLKVDNVMRVKCAEVRPGSDPVITISGANRAGKTSLMRSMTMTLGGARATPQEPLRRGAVKGGVKLDLGEIKAELKLRKGKKPQLVVTGGEGTPQAVLDRLRNKQMLDVRRFADVLDGPGRIAVVQGLTGLDFTRHDQKRAGVYEKRKDANSEVKRLRGALESTEHHEGVPDAVASVAKLTSELQAAMERNAANGEKRRRLEEARSQADHQRAQVKSLRDQLAVATGKLDAMGVAGKALAAEVAKLEDTSLGELRERVSTVEEVNVKVRANAAHALLAGELDGARVETAKLTDYLVQMDAHKAEAIASAKYPVKGLTIGDGDVQLHGFDFGQASGRERLVAAAAVDLALHPDLRVVFIDEASNIDAEGRVGLEEWAEANDAQLWMVLAGDEPASIIMEEGEVKQTESSPESPGPESDGG